MTQQNLLNMLFSQQQEPGLREKITENMINS